MPTDAETWLERFADALGVDAPSQADVDALLQLASTAAHASERMVAPLSCWLAARAGIDPAEALGKATALAEALDGD